jgi:LmbE family N-acetylglucosaminyl deacetylase
MNHIAPCDVLAVFAHPDDETLLAGGLLAACARAGQRVGIVSFTRGEWGPRATDPRSSEGLGRVREAELAAAAQELGASWSCCLGFPDGGLEGADRSHASAVLARVWRQSSPRALVTFADDGLYWHPDHLAVRDFVLDIAGDSMVHEATWARERVKRAVCEARRRGVAADLWGIAPDAFGSPESTIARRLDVRPFLALKQNALRCYRTQLAPDHLLFDPPEDLARDLLGYEWLKSPRGGGWVAEIVDHAPRHEEVR